MQTNKTSIDGGVMIASRQWYATMVLAGASLSLCPGRVSAQTRVASYELAVRVNPDSAWLGVSGTVTLPPADTARPRLRLALSSAFANVRFRILSSGEDDPRTTTDSADGSTTWTLTPARPVPPHTRVVVRFSYDAVVASERSFHVGRDGSFLELGWYPQSKETAGVVSRATGTIAVQVPRGYTVVASGDRTSTRVEEEAGDFRFVTSVPRRLAFAAARYAVARHDGGVTVSLYLLRDRENKQAYVDSAARALGILIREFGPLPYRSLAIVELPGGPARSAGYGGRSVNGMVFIDGANIDQGYFLAFVAHEISHQWWGDSVEPAGSDGEQFMLTEAMANFGALRVVDRIQGAAMAEQFRRVGYPGYHDTDLAYYLEFAATGLDTIPLTRLTQPLAHDLAATKGFRVWDMLAGEVGRDAFRSALRDFVRTHAFGTVTWNMFAEAIEGAARRRMTWFFDEWLTALTGAPEWQLDWRWNRDSVQGTITQVGMPYRATVQVQPFGHETPVAKAVTLTGPVTRFAFGARSRPDSVVVDPHFLMLHWTPENSAEPRGTALYGRANWLDNLGKTAEAFAAYSAGLDSVPANDAWNQRYLLEYGLGWMNLRASRWEDAKTHMQRALQRAAVPTVQPLTCRRPGYSCAVPWGYYVVAKAAQQQGDSVLLCHAIEGAAAADSGSRWGAANQSRALGPSCQR